MTSSKQVKCIANEAYNLLIFLNIFKFNARTNDDAIIHPTFSLKKSLNATTKWC